MPQFLRRWGTLYPFLCHGVEGRHRFFKADLHLSCGSQWDPRGAQVGFTQVIKLDRIGWALRSLRLEEGDKKRYRVQRSKHLVDIRLGLEERLRSRCALVRSTPAHNVKRGVLSGRSKSEPRWVCYLGGVLFGRVFFGGLQVHENPA